MSNPSLDACLDQAVKLFWSRLEEKVLVQVTGLADSLRVPQFEQLCLLEQKCIHMEVEAATKVLQSKMEYQQAVAEVTRLQRQYFNVIEEASKMLEERNEMARDINIKLRSGDYSSLSTSAAKSAPQTPSTSKGEEGRTPPKPDRDTIQRIRERLKKMPALTPSRPVLRSVNFIDPYRANMTPVQPRAGGVLLASQGSLDGSVVPNREPAAQLAKWDPRPMSQPNFDDTLDEAEEPPMHSMPNRPKLLNNPPLSMGQSSSSYSTQAPSSHPPANINSSSVLSLGIASMPQRPKLRSEFNRSLLNK